MRINAINTINYATLKNARINKRTMLQDKPEEAQVNSPSFRGSKGRAVGSLLGFIGGCALVALAPATLLAVPGLIAVGVATKAGGDAGDKMEEKNKRKNRPNDP